MYIMRYGIILMTSQYILRFHFVFYYDVALL